MSASIKAEVGFRRLCCTQCATVYFFPEDWCEQARRAGRSWNCPNGHSQWFGESETDRLRRERDRLKQDAARLEESTRAAWATATEEHERAQAAERRASAARGQVTRLKNRAANGVCPCCNRTFQNLARHMASQHPGFAAEEADGAA